MYKAQRFAISVTLYKIATQGVDSYLYFKLRARNYLSKRKQNLGKVLLPRQLLYK